MNVLLISPGYPAEIPLFARALAASGARVLGIGDQPPEAIQIGHRRGRQTDDVPQVPQAGHVQAVRHRSIL